MRNPKARAATNRRWYDKNLRRTHIGPLAPLCRQRGPVVARGATCKTCLMVERSRRIGSRVNEWEQKRLDRLFRSQASERSAAWRKRNPEAARAASKRWRDKNLDVHRVACREWAANNRTRRRDYNRNYAARRRAESQTN